MKAFAIIAVFAVLSAGAYAGVQPKSLLTDIMKGILNNNRDKLANINLNIDLKERGSVNLTVVGAENVEILKLEAPGPLSLTVSNATLQVPLCSLENGQYEFNEVVVPDLDVTLDGKGIIGADIIIPWITVELDCALKGLSFQIKDFKRLALSVQSIENLVLEGIDDGVVKQLTDWIPKFVSNDLPKIAEENKAVILDKINEVLGGVSYY